jgi:hypothetical protein
MNISFNPSDHDSPILAEISSCITRIVQVIDAWTQDNESCYELSTAFKQTPEDNRRELFDMCSPFDRKHFKAQAEYFWRVVAKRKCAIHIKSINYSPITYLIYLVIHRSKLDARKVIANDLNDDDLKRLVNAIGELAKCDIHTYDCRYFDYVLPRGKAPTTMITI